MSDSDGEEVERRRSIRLDMEKTLVDIVWTDDNGTERYKKIACLDFARGGVKLDCDEPLLLNTAVTVAFKTANASSQKLFAKVIRCTKQKSGWFEIALMLEQCSR